MANFPTRIAFRVAAHTDSERILDVDDAEHLLGLGDMLFRGPGSKVLTRIQGVYVNDMESARIRERLKSMYGDMKPNALPPMRGTVRNQIDVLRGKLVDIARDALQEKAMLHKAIRIVIETKHPSKSYIQRNLRIGYNNACALMEAMERFDIVSPQVGTEPRRILVDTYEEALSRLPKQN